MAEPAWDHLGERSHPDDLTDGVTAGTAAYTGRRCIYRLGFTAMDLPGLPGRLELGRVRLLRGTGPVMTQRTTIVQRPGDALVLEKRMHPLVAVGAGLPLSILEIEDVFPADSSDAFDDWYAEATSAAGMVSALLDERLFQRPVLEDVVLFDEAGDEVVGAADARMRLRHFLPYPVTQIERDAIADLAERLAPRTPEATAARWYLRAAQAGPVADSIVNLWIAIDGLLGTAGDRVVPALHARFDELEIDLDVLAITPGRLYGLRGDIVHRGLEHPPQLQQGFYVLEALTRTLLRAAVGLQSDWPAQVGQLSSPTKDIAALEAAWRNPQVILATTSSPASDGSKDA